MPRILIAGCGYVGVATAKLFHDAGWNVEGWTSSPESAHSLASSPFAVRPVDITDRAAIAAAHRNFDAVIQSVSSGGGDADAYRAIYLRGAQNLASIFLGVPLLFTSSTSVYAQTGGEWVTEVSSAEPTRATAVVLRETEEFVLAHGGTVARLAGIYGPGRSALLRKFLDGTATLEGAGERFINQVHRDDVASALFLLTQIKPAQNEPKIFNVCDGRPLTERECYATLAAHFGRPMPAKAARVLVRKRGNSNKRVSSEKLQQIGWFPRFADFRMGMLESVIPELQNGGQIKQ